MAMTLCVATRNHSEWPQQFAEWWGEWTGHSNSHFAWLGEGTLNLPLPNNWLQNYFGPGRPRHLFQAAAQTVSKSGLEGLQPEEEREEKEKRDKQEKKEERAK